MAKLAYTPLRHQLLTEFAAGGMKYVPGWMSNPGKYTRKGEVGGLRGAEKRALGELVGAALVTYDSTPGPSSQPAFPTKSGYAVLAAWDAKHGPINIEEK